MNIKLGDIIAKVLHWGPIGWVVHKVTGLEEPCDNCKERQERWNQLLQNKKEEK